MYLISYLSFCFFKNPFQLKIKAVTIRSYSSGNYLDGRGPQDAGINKVYLTNRDPDGDKNLQWLLIPVGIGNRFAIQSVSSGYFLDGRAPQHHGPQLGLKNSNPNDAFCQWEMISYGNTIAIRSITSRNYLDGRNPEHTGAQLYLTNRNPSGDRYLKWIVTEVSLTTHSALLCSPCICFCILNCPICSSSI